MNTKIEIGRQFASVYFTPQFCLFFFLMHGVLLLFLWIENLLCVRFTQKLSNNEDKTRRKQISVAHRCFVGTRTHTFLAFSHSYFLSLAQFGAFPSLSSDFKHVLRMT